VYLLKNNFHKLRQNKRLSMQDNFLFIDVESNINKTEKNKQVLTFKMCCAIFWKRSTNFLKKFPYYSIDSFWNVFEFYVEYLKYQNAKQLIMFAHNIEFDLRQLNGYENLFKRDWELVSHYIKGSVYIFIFSKNDFLLHVWSTTNYVKKPLKSIGDTLNLPKLDINFEKDSDEELEVYCMRDTEIIYLFIKQLVEFLQDNDLSRLKATAGALSLNIFKHKFYNDERSPIFIHDWKKTVLLERESYKGGITDCFQLGEKQETYKLDINSMYPKSMRDCRLPSKLIAWVHESNRSQKELFHIYRRFKDLYGIIAKVIVNIPKKYAYIMHDYGLGKSSFCYGENMEITVCSPELNFIEKYGKIIKIKQLAIYRMKRIFRKFVKFFYKLRLYYKQIGNDIYVEFCKLILNTLYGKFGQKATVSKMLTKDDKSIIKYQEAIMVMIKRRKEILEITDKDLENNIIYLGTIINVCELYLIDKKLYFIQQTSENSRDSFVAISSFITSYSRMMLVDYILKAKRKNVFYTDTDSLFVNQEGYNNLLEDIDTSELGKLKLEETGSCIIYAPKFYDFNSYRKIKGVRQKNSILLEETDTHVIYQVEQWERSKASFKDNNVEQQVIVNVRKKVKKLYTKGNVDQNGIVKPYSITEIKAIE
jgi:hypothetical protein